MNPTMIAFGLVSVMLCLGMLFRAKVPFFRKMLMPSSVIAGIIGFLFMNIVPNVFHTNLGGVDDSVFNTLVNVLFTISFIGITLTDAKKEKKKPDEEGRKQSGALKGGLAMGIIWSALFVFTCGLGYFIILFVGKPFGMAPEYGTLIPNGFCQGPGQAATMGMVYETTYGYPNSAQVGITFAVVGFLSAFFIGVPLARYGLKKKIAKYSGKITPSVEKGYFQVEEQREPAGKITMHAGNIDTLATHMAVIGICYLLAIGVSKVVYYIPVFGPTFSGMLFFCGMIAAYIVKFILKKLNLYFVINGRLLARITGMASDYLVVCAFMAVTLSAVGIWLIPIIIECVIVTLITLAFSLYFGERIGGENDFERVLGLYGTCTGTTPSGVALVRMVDPSMKTTTIVELGMMNMFMLFSMPGTIFVTLGMTDVIPMSVAAAAMVVIGLLYIVLLKVTKTWNKPTFTLAKGRISDGTDSEMDYGFVRGFLREDYDFQGIVK